MYLAILGGGGSGGGFSRNIDLLPASNFIAMVNLSYTKLKQQVRCSAYNLKARFEYSKLAMFNRAVSCRLCFSAVPVTV